ncbi:MAG TPA: tRNA (adenine-N1)-methyltransferase [Anaerolineales bacterium]|nr:tRNA (adenine-N1)-methyltransferase [Anaerolineales bacterium]
MENEQLTAQAGDLAQLVGLSHKNFILRLTPGEQLQTHRGVLYHNDLIGKLWGSEVFSHLGNPFFLLQPALGELIREIRRTTQILYPKDIGFILITMGIGSGQHVLEAGTGSGAMTTALAFAVGPQGHITTYEMRPDIQQLAQKNLARLGLSDRVTFKLANIESGFDERGTDALFMDIPNPEDYIPQVRAALKPGGFFGCILPTLNQITRLLPALHRENFAFIEVCETILRYYKPVAERIRPTDRMVAHTGYLIFARPIIPAKVNQRIEPV